MGNQNSAKFPYDVGEQIGSRGKWKLHAGKKKVGRSTLWSWSPNPLAAECYLLEKYAL